VGAVFLGTPAAAVPSLAALADVADVDTVITQPDRPSGRGTTAMASPVKVAAKQFGFRVLQPATREELHDTLVAGSFRFGLVVAFGRILTPAMLSSTDAGFLNVHFSLLPRWRGAAPVERAIAAGDERTGVTLMKLDEGLDTGPIIGEIATPIGEAETGGGLTARLSHLGATLVDTLVPDYLSGRRVPVAQLDTEPTNATRLSKQEAMLTPSTSAIQAERLVRAFHPRPGAWLNTPEGPLRVHAAQVTGTPAEAGTIIRDGDRVIAGFVDGCLRLDVVQTAGKSPVDAMAWMHGRRGVAARFTADRS
jgi:methionyl-tRNA formyltransferase